MDGLRTRTTSRTGLIPEGFGILAASPNHSPYFLQPPMTVFEGAGRAQRVLGTRYAEHRLPFSDREAGYPYVRLGISRFAIVSPSDTEIEEYRSPRHSTYGYPPAYALPHLSSFRE